MIEILDKVYPWSREGLKELTDKLLRGHELTICKKDKKAWVDKYNNYGNGCKEVYIGLAELYVHLGIVGAESGNLETGEEHYIFSMR